MLSLFNRHAHSLLIMTNIRTYHLNIDKSDAGGTLLSNSLCDDITPAECLAGADGATGNLIRNTQQLSFIPHQNLPAINW